MKESANEAKRTLADTLAKIKMKEQSMTLLSTEKEDCLERLRKV
jgi:hypothetical protein